MQKLQYSNPNKNVDEYSLITNLLSIKDGYIDEAKSIHKRPALKRFTSTGSGRRPDGVFNWDAMQMTLIVSNTNVYKITDNRGTVVQIASGIMNLDTRVCFQEIYDIVHTRLIVLMANGGNIYWTNGTTATLISGGLTPSKCTSITALDGYALVNDLDNPYSFHQAVVGDPTNFGSGANTYSSQLFTDPIYCLGVNNDKVYVLSGQYIETYYDSGNALPFQAVPGGVVNWGVASKDAVAYLGDIIFIMNRERDILNIQNFSSNIISLDYAKFLETLPVVNDVEFDLVKSFGGRKWLVMTFKDANVTIVYDLVTKAFYEWGKWQDDHYDRFAGRLYDYASQWDFHILADKDEDIIYTFDPDTYLDDGKPIRTEIITAHYIPESMEIIDSVKTLIDCKRGVGDTSLENPPEAQWQVKDNRDVDFKNQVSIPLGSYGESKLSDPLIGTGRYRTRQHRIIHQDNSEFVFYGIYEEIAHE